MSAMVIFARELARWLHRDQVDKQGKPYFDHVVNVEARLPRGSDPILRAAAYLHDAIEDGRTSGRRGVSVDLLLDVGIPQEAALLVRDLTRGSEETYAAYIERVSRDRWTATIKLADLADNLDPIREIAPSLTRRYEKARQTLLKAWPDLEIEK